MNLTFYTNESGSWESFGSINLGSDNKFGYTESGDSTDDADGTILGTWFTCPADGTAYGIDFYAECGGAQEYPEHVKCALYYKSNNTFINETIEGSYEGLLSEPVWYELTFETPPTLVAGEEYYVVLWADETQGGNDIFYSNLPQFNRTISMTQNYNSTWPSTLSNLTYVTGKTYDFYVRYNTTSTPNGTYYMDNLAMGDVGSTYFWNVSVDDGSNVVLSDTYQFMVGKQSKIKNTGSTNISGYLLMQVQYYNATQGWVVDNDTINETNPRTVAAGDQLALDLIFNGNVTTSDLVNGDGTYRVYAAFRDEEGDVLVCDDESLLEAWYQFTVDTS